MDISKKSAPDETVKVTHRSISELGSFGNVWVIRGSLELDIAPDKHPISLSSVEVSGESEENCKSHHEYV